MQHHYRSSRKLLCKRSEPENRLGRIRHIVLDICHTVALADDGLAVTGNKYRARKFFEFYGRSHIPLDLSGDLFIAFLCVNGLKCQHKRADEKQELNHRGTVSTFHIYCIQKSLELNTR